MSSNSTEAVELHHYAYLIIRIYPPFPREISLLCHYGETNDVFFLGGMVKLTANVVNIEICVLPRLLKTLTGLSKPFEQFGKMHLYREQITCGEYDPVKY
jgi:hypothetical protein